MELNQKSKAVVAALIAAGFAVPHGATVQADDVAAPPTSQVSSTDAAQVRDRFDALIDEVTTRLAAGEEGAPSANAEVGALQEELTTAQTQIEVLKAVVVEALLAQSKAETTLASIRGETAAQLAAAKAERAEVEARNQVLAEELEAVTDSLAGLKTEVDDLRDGDAGARDAAAAGSPPTDGKPGSAGGMDEAAAAPDPAAAGGPLAPIDSEASEEMQEEPPAVVASVDEAAIDEASADYVVDADSELEVGLVHFDPGSAMLTPGGVRKTQEAAERIRSMEVAAVRVVGYADTVGDAGINQHLSHKRADSIAAMLQDIGIPASRIEIVGRGEEGIPEPTADGVSEPLNRCAGIFVVPAFPK